MTQTTSVETLRRFPLFATLRPGEIKILADSFEEVYAEAGDVIIHEGARTEKVFLLLEGEVDIIKSLGTGDERLLARRGSGTSLGDMSLFTDQRTHTASVRACTHLHMLVMTLIQYDLLIRSHPELCYGMLRMFSKRLTDTENLVIADLREKNAQLTQAYEELKAAQAIMIEKEKLEHELSIASVIQRSILPQRLPTHPGLDFGALMIPARQVGGDFYDFIPLPDGRMGVLVGDVCDKGIPAALFMALTYSSLRSEADRYSSPGAVLRAVNQHLLQINTSSMYVTLLYGILDLASGRFRYARAGHPYPLLLDEQRRPMTLPSGIGQPLGMFPHVRLDEQEITIPAGGSMLIYSDGLSETLDALEPPQEVDALCAQLMVQPDFTCAQDLCDLLWRSASGTGSESSIQDDFTVVAVCARQPAA